MTFVLVLFAVAGAVLVGAGRVNEHRALVVAGFLVAAIALALVVALRRTVPTTVSVALVCSAPVCGEVVRKLRRRRGLEAVSAPSTPRRLRRR